MKVIGGFITESKSITVYSEQPLNGVMRIMEILFDELNSLPAGLYICDHTYTYNYEYQKPWVLIEEKNGQQNSN